MTVKNINLGGKAQLQSEQNISSKERDGAILNLLLQTGIKSSELVQLNVRDVWMHDRIKNWLVIKKETKKSKVSERRIPINKEAQKSIQILLNYNQSQGFFLEPDFPLLASRQKNKINGSYRITTRQIQRIIKTLKNDLANNSNITPQSLRHIFAQRLLEKGVNISEVQKLLGHQSIKTTKDLYRELDENAKTN